MSLLKSSVYFPGLKALFLSGALILSCSAFAQKPKNSPPPKSNSKPAQPPHSNAPPSRQSNANVSHGNNAGPNGRTNQSGGINGRSANAGNMNGRGSNNGGMNNNAHGGMNNNARGGMNSNARGGMNNNARGGMNNNARGGMNNNARGGMNNNARGNMNAHRGPATTAREIHTRSGAVVHASFRGGHVRSIQAHGMRIDHGVHGGRRIVSEHNGRRIVSMGPHRGYTQRAYYSHGGRVYVQRTYYAGGRRYAYAYRTSYYGGRPYYGYAPAYYYHPVYYGWAYNPWPAPVAYRWGYYNDPWYASYGYYYTPYPVYPSAALWLTDYLIAESLRAAYEAQQSGSLIPMGPMNASASQLIASLTSTDPMINATLYPGSDLLLAMPAAAAGAQLSPEAKQAIAEEVKSQIGAEKAAAENQSASGGDNGPPAALDPQHHTFIVGSNVDTSTDDGDDCSLTAGDVIYRTGDTPDSDNNVTATVKSSKKEDCAVGANISVDVDDLQEMHNHLRETLDAGLKDLASKQGKDGLPAAPDTATTAGEVPAPAADTNVDNDLAQQQKDADQTEADVNSSSDNNQ
ncbi:MAG TPA: hypothetical protein VHV29_15570 [Terriglobales bacterium]|nr:hypothetical protein [Terriglobales bacterium]